MLNDHDLAEVLMWFCSTLVITTIGFATLWVRARERALRATLALRTQQQNPSTDITHIVHSVDAIAVEVERISEAQRFTAQLLVDRAEPVSAPRRVPEHVVTPH